MRYNIVASLRTEKKDAKGLAPIYIFIYAGTKLLSKISLKQKIDPVFWITKERKIDKKCPNADLLNTLISKTITDLQTKILQERITKGSVDLPLLLNKKKFRDINFYEFAEKQISEKNYAEETRRNYRVYVEKIKTYRKALKLSEIDYRFLQGYESHLRDVLKNEPNTVWGNLKFINTLINDALKMKFITEDPFKIYKRPKYKQTKRSFLNIFELQKIEKFANETKDNGLKVVANYFLFMAYTGLRFSDAIRFRSSEHIVDGERIVMETKKTKQTANLFINDKVRPLIEFVDNNPLRIEQTDFNRKLKLIAAYQGITKKMSSHVARHSFGASLVALGVPEKVAQGLLSHGSAASTKIYYHLQTPSLDEAMKLFNKDKK